MQKDNPKYIRAWTFYDWANSVYSLVITSAIFPTYFAIITHSGEANEINILGMQAETAFDFSLALSFLIIVFISPVLSSIADTLGNKLQFLKIFCYTGAISCMALAFMNENTLILGLILNVLASIGFWGSLVFYNAYLPEISSDENMDTVSAKGFIMGYIGSVILLMICLVLIQVIAPKDQQILYTQLSFVLTGLWWMGFAQYTFANLPQEKERKIPEEKILSKARKELHLVLKQIQLSKNLKLFLGGFFFYSLGMQTIFLMAALYGKSELGLPTEKLIYTILAIQLEAILGAWLFQYLSKKMGNKYTLMLGVIIWIFICIIAYTLNRNNPNVEYQFYGVAALVGFVMGGIQALSRSTYGKLLPPTKDTTTFFSFYDIFEKLALFFGLVVFGLMNEHNGMKSSVLAMGVAFFISLLFLTQLNKRNIA